MKMPTDRCAYLLGEESLEIRRVRRTKPGRGELIVAIETATTCGTDVKVFRRGGHPTMLTPPCPFGHEMAGTIVELGEEVATWEVGDAVIVANSSPCDDCSNCRSGRENLCLDLQYLNGGFAQRLLVPARFVDRSIHRKPSDLSFRLAALAEPLACVVHGLSRMPMGPGSRALVIGGGPIGLMFAYLLSQDGHRPTLADPNEERLRVARQLGADTVRIADRRVPAIATDYDAAVDATGSPEGWEAAIRSVRAGGCVNLFGGCAPGTLVSLDAGRAHYQELTLLGSYHHRPETFARAIEILAELGAPLESLISYDCGLDDLEDALCAMIDRRALKVAVRPRGVAD